MSFLLEVADQLNLRWAWEKVRREATPGDIWFDEVELARFELELEKNLQDIAVDFRKGRYHLKPLRPLPFPKNDKKDGTPQVRQIFQVAIRDQVAWMAVTNVVGPYVDSNMPTWSYGNRLYRSIWVEKDKNDGKKRRKIGRYRHATGRLYLPFGQSWPLFRRHVYLATRAMTQYTKHSDMDKHTEEEQDIQERLAEKHQCPFLTKEYWRKRKPTGGEPELYWCSIDLEKFYPTMKLRVVRENIVEELPNEWRDDASKLIKSMLQFRLDLQDWSGDDLKKMDIKIGRKEFTNIPTGLYVAGFLANTGLLKVDREVAKRLSDPGCRIAHFRFVDDHIFLAFHFDELLNWLNDYMTLLTKTGTGAKVNLEGRA